ncbi:putative DNA-binding transcriptional regulator YafY [Streptomyces sp. Amel2xB2]|uniref:helix-turn-helix transcriptional regulator n=1 Tax=Streptomyces sp. Amel2xB2 TaxID=1305829 RepID=UPI000DBF8ABB|nr:WYL domain-containing protein [Streptomyces sp. Amel2xB2]RAJ58375.1 putative DNA-binding transcriptional regulator YafY [Streptomyces sp. Amel2xB2]
MADVTERTLALLSALQTGRPFSGAELTRRLGVSMRTLRRDVDRLRGYGYPVETRPGPGGHYRLAAGRTMPPLVLDDDEAVATLLALASLASTGTGTGTAAGEFVGGAAESDEGRSRGRSPSRDGAGAGAGSTGGAARPVESAGGSVDDAALRAYGKLDQYLPARLRPRVAAVRASLETSPQHAPGVAAGQFAVVAEAVAHRETLSFAYTDARGTLTRRRVEPYRQVHHLLRWYLLAWDLGRQDWRVFRLDRITEALRTGERYAPRALPAESAADYLRQGLNRDRQPVEIVVEAPAADVADALVFQDAEIRPLGERRTRVRLALDSWPWLLFHLAFLDADFALDAGEDVVADCRRFAVRLLSATREPVPERGERGE